MSSINKIIVNNQTPPILEIVQTTGQSDVQLMSQNAITENIYDNLINYTSRSLNIFQNQIMRDTLIMRSWVVNYDPNGSNWSIVFQKYRRGNGELYSYLTAISPIIKDTTYSFIFGDSESNWCTINKDLTNQGDAIKVCGRNGAPKFNRNCTANLSTHICTFVAPEDGYLAINIDLRKEFSSSYILDYEIWLGDGSRPESYLWGIKRTDLLNANKIQGNYEKIGIIFKKLGTETHTNIFSTTQLCNYDGGPYPNYVGGASARKPDSGFVIGVVVGAGFVKAGTRNIAFFKKVRNSENTVVGATLFKTISITSSEDWNRYTFPEEQQFFNEEDIFVAIEILSADDFKKDGSSILFYDGSHGDEVLYMGGDFQTQFGYEFASNIDFIIKTIETPEPEPQTNTSDWSNLNVLIMGDSITWQGGDNCDQANGWNTWFKQKANPKNCISYARSGATMTNTSSTVYNITENTGSTTNDNNFYNQINRVIYNYDQGILTWTPDVLLVALGTNDFGRPKTPDAQSVFESNINSYTTTDSVQTKLSIAQAMRYGVEMLIQKFPNLQIMFITPQQSTWNTFENRKAVGDQIEQSCNYMGLPCLRLDKCGGTWLVRESVSVYKTIDGCHTSEEGARQNGYFIERWARLNLHYTTE